jgi:hypothetical protein
MSQSGIGPWLIGMVKWSGLSRQKIGFIKVDLLFVIVCLFTPSPFGKDFLVSTSEKRLTRMSYNQRSQPKPILNMGENQPLNGSSN